MKITSSYTKFEKCSSQEFKKKNYFRVHVKPLYYKQKGLIFASHVEKTNIYILL